MKKFSYYQINIILRILGMIGLLIPVFYISAFNKFFFYPTIILSILSFYLISINVDNFSLKSCLNSKNVKLIFISTFLNFLDTVLKIFFPFICSFGGLFILYAFNNVSIFYKILSITSFLCCLILYYKGINLFITEDEFEIKCTRYFLDFHNRNLADIMPTKNSLVLTNLHLSFEHLNYKFDHIIISEKAIFNIKNLLHTNIPNYNPNNWSNLNIESAFWGEDPEITLSKNKFLLSKLIGKDIAIENIILTKNYIDNIINTPQLNSYDELHNFINTYNHSNFKFDVAKVKVLILNSTVSTENHVKPYCKKSFKNRILPTTLHEKTKLISVIICILVIFITISSITNNPY